MILDNANVLTMDAALPRSKVLAIGCRFGEVGTGSYGIEPPQPLIHIDIQGDVIGRNYPVHASVVGDAAVHGRPLRGRAPKTWSTSA